MNSTLTSRKTTFVIGASAQLSTHNPENKDRGILTFDGVHMSFKGNCMLAEQMLRALGVAPKNDEGFEAELVKLEPALNEIAAARTAAATRPTQPATAAGKR